jgi:hypothetical protein
LDDVGAQNPGRSLNLIGSYLLRAAGDQLPWVNMTMPHL